VIIDVITRLALPLDKLRGHCFDGAANMNGCIKGVQQPLSVYVQCSNHSLDLAPQETALEIPLVRNMLQTVRMLPMSLVSPASVNSCLSR